MRHHRIARVGVVAASLLLVATACGTDRDEEDPSAGEETTAAAAANLPTDTFGDLEAPCGDGDASGATDPGVTDETITIGYGDDKGYPATPGLNQEMGDAMDAFVEWCNGLGGINGREIVGNRYDGMILESAKVIKESCGQDFMLVGQGFALDANIEPDRIGCQMPTVAGFAISPQAAMGPMKYEPVPGPVDLFNDADIEVIVENYPEFKNVAFLNSDSPAVDQAGTRYTDNFKGIGITPKDCGVELKSAGGDNYRAIVQKFKECDVDALFTWTPPSPPIYNFLDAAKVEGFDVPLANAATWYTDGVLKANVGDLTEGTIIALNFQPFENADVVPAVADYRAVLEQTGGEQGLLGMQSASAFLLWATVAKDCGSELTRQCMVDGLAKVNEWTGGGLHGTSDPGNNTPQECAILVTVAGRGYEQIQPAEKGEWYCSKNGARKAPEAAWGVELTDDRIATTFLTDDVLTPKG
ncbi:ABC transporter substrate-binding protein [Nocardioides sp. zg-DK7169]|uniref:ABC transporter substrate-binding protein n=1 Tax=Nocardioides sp. zg-DK7169 TaxID=2736600 RepID=UPI0015535987|nr:ABC transporter substrate-binding protein [Nocardioides sp. zg-DK7169]NPC98150.1 ABC transporter substrate-binding protein [Nocardioides sp. zg-DK7169]